MRLPVLGLVTSAAFAAASILSSESCCGKLNATLVNKVSVPGSELYVELNDRWSETSVRSPNCIVHPSTTTEVSLAVAALTRNNCSFAVKSGGHTPNPRANDIDDGVTLDLSFLNTTTATTITNATDGTQETVLRLGVGATWQDAYDALPGYSFPGGQCGGTGVGGVTLGGGLSLLVSLVGWVGDTVRNFEIVLANGTVVNANASTTSSSDGHHFDLFRALQGGGGPGANLGILTHIDLAPVPDHDGNVYLGQILLPAGAAESNVTSAVMSGLATFTKAMNDDVEAAVIAQFQYTNSTSVVEVLVAHNDGETAPILDPLLSVGPSLSLEAGVTNMSAIAVQTTELYPDGYRNTGATCTIVNDAATALALENITAVMYAELLEQVPSLEVSVSFQPVPAVATEQSRKAGDSLRSAGADEVKDRVVVFMTPRWSGAEHDAAVYNATKTWYSQAMEAAASRNTSDPFVYTGFAAGWQDPLGSNGEASLAFYRDVARRYDPDRVFQTLVPGGFKLDNAGA